MTYKISTGIAYISGIEGKYGRKVDQGINYGRNAIFSFQDYFNNLANNKNPNSLENISNICEDILDLKNRMIDEDLDKLLTALTGDEIKIPLPIDFEVRYMPENKFDPMALMGAAFEDLKKQFKIPLDKDNKNLSSEFTLEAFSNKGEIGLAENAAAILMEDMSSGITPEEVAYLGRLDLNANNITGSFNQNGTTNLKFFQKPEEKSNTKNIVESIIKYFNLEEEAEKAKKLIRKEFVV